MATPYWQLLNKYLGEDKKKKDGKITVVMIGPDTMYTGKGPDGVVQPNKPAMIDHSTNPPSVYHEDEKVTKSADGRLMHVEPSPMTMAKTEQDQEDMAEMQKMQNWPGYQFGFDIKKPQSLVPDMSNVTYQDSGSPFKSNFKPAQSLVPDMTPNIDTSNVFNPATVSQPVAKQTAVETPVNIDTSNVFNPAIATTPTTPATVNTTSPTYVKPPVNYMAGATEGYGGLLDVARGQSEVSRLANEKAYDYLAATGAGQLGTAQQQWLSSGVSPETMAALTSQNLRSQDITRGGVAKDLAINEATRAEAAQKDLISQGSTLQGMEEAKYNFDVLKRTTEGQRLASLLQQHFDAGTDWRNDPTARQAAQAAWESQGGTGTVSDDWIDQQSKFANTNQIDASWREIEGSDWYSALPETEQTNLRNAYPILASLASTGGVKPVQAEDGSLIFVDTEGNTVWSPTSATTATTNKSIPELSTDALTIGGFLGDASITAEEISQFNSEFGRGMSGDNDTEYLDAFKAWRDERKNTDNLDAYLAGDTTEILPSTRKLLDGIQGDMQYDTGDGGSLEVRRAIELYNKGELTDAQKARILQVTGEDSIDKAMNKMLQANGIPDIETYNKVINSAADNVVSLDVAKNGKTEDNGAWYPGGFSGNMHWTTSYPKNLYDVELNDVEGGGTAKAPDTLVFNSETLQWAEENKGKMIKVDGKDYWLDANQPILKGAREVTDTYAESLATPERVLTDFLLAPSGPLNLMVNQPNTIKATVTADALNLIDPETGTRTSWIPDISVKITD